MSQGIAESLLPTAAVVRSCDDLRGAAVREGPQRLRMNTHQSCDSMMQTKDADTQAQTLVGGMPHRPSNWTTADIDEFLARCGAAVCLFAIAASIVWLSL